MRRLGKFASTILYLPGKFVVGAYSLTLEHSLCKGGRCLVFEVSSLGVEFLGRFENRLGAECGPAVVVGEQGLEFADDLLGCGFFRLFLWQLEETHPGRRMHFLGRSTTQCMV